MDFLWPADGPRPGAGPPEAFVLFAARGRRTLRLASNLAYEVWLDGRFAGDGGHRCVDGEAPLDAWDATGADEVLLRLHWLDPTRTQVYLRRPRARPALRARPVPPPRGALGDDPREDHRRGQPGPRLVDRRRGLADPGGAVDDRLRSLERAAEGGGGRRAARSSPSDSGAGLTPGGRPA